MYNYNVFKVSFIVLFYKYTLWIMDSMADYLKTIIWQNFTVTSMLTDYLHIIL